MKIEDCIHGISKENFRTSGSKLINECFLIKDKEDTRDDYFRVKKNFELFSDYFSLIGYSLKIDDAMGVIGLVTENKKARVRFTIYETIILLILRILYFEVKETLSITDEVIATLEDIHNKYNMLGIKNKSILDKKTLNDAIAKFKKCNIVEKLDADIADKNTRIIIYPSIFFAISNESVNDMYEKTKDRLATFVVKDEGDAE